VSAADVLSAEGLAKRYGDREVVSDVSFALRRGEVFGFLGPNGAGKTTTIRMLVGLVRPSRGRVVIDGHDLGREFEAAMRRVGCIVETPDLYRFLTGRENLEHFARMLGDGAAARIDSLAALVHMDGRLDGAVRTYSLGMRQRVGIAQALLSDPAVLILDEPTNGLDPAGRDEMLELIHRIGTEFGIAIVLATHLLGEVERVGTNLVAIEGGRLLRSAPLGEFTEQTGTLAVEVEEGSDRLAEQLTQGGLAVMVDGRAVLVAMSDPRVYDLVRDAVAEFGLPLVRIEPRRRRLEDLFRDAPASDSAPGGARVSATPAAPPPAATGGAA